MAPFVLNVSSDFGDPDADVILDIRGRVSQNEIMSGVVVDFGQTVSYKCSDSSQALHFDHDYDETELQIKCLDDGSWELNAFLEAAFCVSEEGESERMMAMPSLHFIIIVVSIL